jgi:hypothetical protein
MLWSGFFSDAKVHVGKITHIWRGQGEQELDESGVSIVSIGRMTGHAVERSKKKEGPTKAQSQSYITNPPTDAVVGRDGGNWRNPYEHCPPCERWFVSDNLMNTIPQVCELMANYQQVLAHCATCITHKEIQEKRLFTACGTLGAVLMCFQGCGVPPC